MTQLDDDRIQAGVEWRLSAVEEIISSPPPWRAAGELDRRPNRIAVVAGPALRRGALDRPRLGMTLIGAATIVFAFGLIYGGLGGLGGPRPSPGWADVFPIQTAEPFERPFTYAIDPASGIEVADISPQLPDLQQFRVRNPADPTKFSRIVGVRGVDLVRVNPCSSAGRGTIQMAGPQPFVDYLRSISGLAVSAPAATTVDGRSAVAVTVTGRTDPTCPGVYIWPNEPAFTDTAAARRIEALDVDGATILVVTAVAEASEMDAWLTTADQLIATFHFISETPHASAKP